MQAKPHRKPTNEKPTASKPALRGTRRAAKSDRSKPAPRARWRPRSSALSARARRRSSRVRVGAVGEQPRHVGGLPFQASLISSSFITGCELAGDSPAVSGCRGASASKTFFLVRSPWTSLTSVRRPAGKPVSKGAIQVTATQHVVACTSPPQRRLPPLRLRQLLQPCHLRCAACGPSATAQLRRTVTATACGLELLDSQLGFGLAWA